MTSCLLAYTSKHTYKWSLVVLLIVLMPFISFDLRADNVQALALTHEERAYLQQHPIIKLANDADWAPFEFIDHQGKLQGIVSDYLTLFEQQLGIKFEIVQHQKWHQLTDAVMSGERPLVMARHATDERKQYMSFTQPYLFFPVVIVAKEGEDYVNSPDQLNGRLIAGVKGFNASHHLAKNYPLVAQLGVDTIQEGLEAVITGKAYGFVGNLGSVTYTIKQHGLDGLQIIGQTGAHAELAIGVHKNEPILFNIMQKVLNNVTPEQSRTFYDKWFQLRTVKQLDKSQIWQLAGYGMILVSFLLIWILIYRYQKHQQRKYIDQINEYSLASLIDINTKNIVWSSQSYAELVGCSAEALIGQNFLKRASKNISDDQISMIEGLLRSGKTWQDEIEGINAKGDHYWVILTLTPQKNWRGIVCNVWATRINITDKKRVEHLSNVDALTGLFNRRYFNTQIDHEINRAKREIRPLAMATFDIDHFKLINDTYGHQQGDEALVMLSQLAMAKFNRASDYIFRVGGEEFMLISHFNDLPTFIDYLEGFREAALALDIPNIKTNLGKMSISIGACYWEPHELSNSEDLYQTLDNCLYEAKNTGRNRLVVCPSRTNIVDNQNHQHFQ